MNQLRGNRPSLVRIVLSSILAAVIGLMQPLLLMFQVITPMPGICIALLAAVVLYAGAGLIPVILLVVCSGIGTMLLLGLPGAAVLAYWLVPACLIIRGMQKKQPFFKQLANGAIAAAVGTVAVLAVFALIFGRDMIEMVINQLRTTFEAQQDQFWLMLEPMFQTPDDTMTKEEFVEWYYQMFNVLQLYHEYYLVANQMTGAILTALLSVLWGNWRMARRGEATRESFRGLGDWFLSANMTWGILLTMVAAWLLTLTPLPTAQTVWVVVSELAKMAFLVQCLAALDRRMRASGSSVTRRQVFIVALLVFGFLSGSGVYQFMTIIGGASALFGRQGAAKPWINKIKDNSDGQGR